MNATRTAKRPVVIITGKFFTTQLQCSSLRKISTRFGEFDVLVSTIGGREVFSIIRHGPNENVPPSEVPYKKYIQFAADVRAEAILATSRVGVIKPEQGLPRYAPGDLILCDDLLPWGIKPPTFFDTADGGVKFTDCSELFSRTLNDLLVRAAATGRAVRLLTQLKEGAVIATTPGPRYETPAEIRVLQSHGVHLVGMTTGYEAILAKEVVIEENGGEKQGIDYTVVAIGTNWTAAKGAKPLSDDDVKEMASKKEKEVYRLVTTAIEIM